MNRVFVLSSTKKLLMPCTPARARRLLNAGKAAVFRMQPFTIILKYRADGYTQPIEFKVDPGSKTTGISLVSDFPQQGRVVVWAANLEHRGQSIVKRLIDRLSIRRGRRSRTIRYREPRWNNRARLSLVGFEKWFAPSLRSRVDNVRVWYNRLLDLAPITEAVIETVRFDMQKLQNPEINGIEYQQGTLFGYELREYLLEKWNRKCAYCGAKNVPLQVEHIIPRSAGGSNRTSNLTLSCSPCNIKKGTMPVEQFISDPKILGRLKKQAQSPLKDAAAINSIRYAVGDAIRSIGLPTSFWSGGRTKMNRLNHGYDKDHWIDAACVGETGEKVVIPIGLKPLIIKATGRGQRQVVKTDKYGFPRKTKKGERVKAGTCKRVSGFQTGDLVNLIIPNGKYAGTYTNQRLSAIKKTGSGCIKVESAPNGQIWTSLKNFRLLQRSDGYEYSFG